MKVLFLADEGFDYLSNQLMEGLWLLSKEGSIDFITTEKVVHHGSMTDDLPVADEQYARSLVNESDMIIFSSAGDWNFIEGRWGDLFRDESLAHKRVFIDGHDGNGYLCDPRMHKLYIKRELRYPEANSMIYGNVRSLLFGVYQFLIDAMPAPDWDERPYDISLICFGGSNTMRSECGIVLDMMNDKLMMHGSDRRFRINCNVQIDGQPLSIQEYRDAMRQTKIGVNIFGAGVDTLRFWETMAHGAVLCSQDPTRQMVMRNAPEPHRHAIYFDSWNRMVEMCRMVVSDRQRWQSMRAASDRLVKCHSTKMRARQLLGMFREVV